MSINLKKFEDKRPVSGYGGALCYVDPSNSEDADLKYHILIPLESLPAVTGSTDSFEYDLLNSPSKGKVQGKGSLEDTDLEFLWHRDNVRRLEGLQGRSIDFMIVYPDFTARKFTGTIKVRPNEISNDVAKGTITITPITASETTILDCRKELKDTVAITSNIDDYVDLKGTASQVIAIATDPTDATITATIDNPSVASVSAFADGKLTITGVAKGNAMVTVKASKVGMASWETTIAVEVTE
jgi:hypothetical protein